MPAQKQRCPEAAQLCLQVLLLKFCCKGFPLGKACAGAGRPEAGGRTIELGAATCAKQEPRPETGMYIISLLSDTGSLAKEG